MRVWKAAAYNQVEAAMRSIMISVYAVLLTTAAQGKDRFKIQIQVVNTQTGQRQFAYAVPETASRSTTDCNGSATATGIGGTATATGSSNCTTTTTPGLPARTVVGSIPQVYVHAIMSDGKRVTLWCQTGLRRCGNLGSGNYAAEIDGNSVWIYSFEIGGKRQKIKYRYAGGW